MIQANAQEAIPAQLYSKAPWWKTTLVPLLLLLVCPPIVPAVWVIVTHLDGSVARASSTTGVRFILDNLPTPTLGAVEVILAFAAFELALLFLLPGARMLGPTTPTGHRPSYRLNGVAAFVVTHLTFAVCAFTGVFPASIVYDRFGAILATLCLFALGFCVVLYYKGKYFPTNSDRCVTGNPIFDYFQGTELHPRLFGVDLKQLCNCRLSMMGWSVILVSFAAGQYNRYGHVSMGMIIAVGLQCAYLLKFFVWEGGYFASLDITHDRFGFYICWGVLCWVPCLYTLSTFFLASHPFELSTLQSAGLITFGLAALSINYLADRQRQHVRKTGGLTKVWGRTPRLIQAPYTTTDGKSQTNLLLASGYWGIARHFHYVPELLLALAWTLPVGGTRVLPYFYFAFLFVLLVDRAGRDDRRCEAKYGDAWHEYRRAVPYKILPGVY